MNNSENLMTPRQEHAMLAGLDKNDDWATILAALEHTGIRADIGKTLNLSDANWNMLAEAASRS